MKATLVALFLAFSTTFAAKADTSLVLKPNAEQLKAAKTLGNKECPVTGEENGTMGKGPVVVYKGKAVQLCCKGCVKSFAKDPDKYLAIAEGSEAAKPATDDHAGHAH